MLKTVVLDAKTTLLTIRAKHREKTFAICNNMCYNYKVVEYRGVKCCFKNLLKRIGFAVGALVVLTVAIITDGYVLDIQYQGNQSVSTSEIADYLGSLGIKVGARKSQIVPDEIESALCEWDKIANCSVFTKGNSLIISVTESESSTPKPTEKDAIVSAYDGKVSKIICRSGTPAVKVGQIVRRGQTLIDGVLYDQNGEVFTTVSAVGEVFVAVTEKKNYFVCGDFYEYRPTGETQTQTALEIFGLRLFGFDSPYPTYKATTSEKTLSGLIPIKVIQTSYAQTQRVKVEKTVEEFAREKVEKAQADAITADFVKVTDSKYHIEKIDDKCYQVTVAITTERKIS